MYFVALYLRLSAYGEQLILHNYQIMEKTNKQSSDLDSFMEQEEASLLPKDNSSVFGPISKTNFEINLDRNETIPMELIEHDSEPLEELLSYEVAACFEQIKHCLLKHKRSPSRGKRNDNTIDRVVLTALRDVVISLCSRGELKNANTAIRSLPLTKVGIEQLFSVLELTSSETRKIIIRVLERCEEIKAKYGMNYENDLDRQRCFYEHFDNAIEALKGKDYKDRLSVLFNGRKHDKQLGKVEQFRQEYCQKLAM